MRRFIGAILVAVVAYWFARAIGIPAWVEWVPGDASDCAVAAFWAAILLSARSAPAASDTADRQRNPGRE